MTVRVSIMLPIALNCCELLKVKKGSNSASLILIYTIVMAILPGCAWLTGGLTGPMIQGVFETIPELASEITFQSWLQCGLAPVMLATLFTALLIRLFLRPEAPLQHQRFDKYEETMTHSEIITAVVLITSCFLFFTGNKHGIPNTTICMIAVVLLFATHVLSPEDFISGINWNLIVFIGSSLSMSRIFSISGISDWLTDTLSAPFVTLSAHPVVFLYVVFTLLFLWRFVDVTTLIPTMVVLAPIIVIVSQQSSIAPIIWAILLSLAVCSFFLTYTNMWTFMGRQMVGSFAWSEKQIFNAGSAFFVACIIALTISIPIWLYQGLLSLS